MVKRRLIFLLSCFANFPLLAAPAVSSNELTLVKDGKAASVILVSGEINESAWFAAGDLADHIFKITGATIPIISDRTDTTELPAGTRILVGDSKWTHEIELANKDFAEQEYLIRFTADTLILMGRDDGGSEKLKPGPVVTNVIPGGDRLQGTSYAVHDFLERYCDVRWYAPTPLGMVYPTTNTLVVEGAEIRRKPHFEYRGADGLSTWGMTPPATNTQGELHMQRLRRGGKRRMISHAFEAYPDRFFKKNPGNPKIWEGEHPEYFRKDANGYPQPDQMCFSSTALVAQVVKDAQSLFSGKVPPGAYGSGDHFALVPRDNDIICLCKKCAAATGKPVGHFSNGEASKLVWKFTIAVANQFTNKLPGKYVGQLAYRNYAFYPTGLTIPTNVIIGPCPWDGERLWSEEGSKYEYNNYKMWASKAPGQLEYLWLYQCFPMETAGSGGFHCFMGFYAHVLEKQMRMFAKDGLRSINLCGAAEYIDGYLTYKLMDDPTLRVDNMLPEFFSRFYGPASNEMANIYWKIEHVYTDLDNYPNKFPSMSESISWKNLGNSKVMGDLQFKMKKALAAAANAETNIYLQRVNQFSKDILDYMDNGYARYEMKVKYKSQAAAARKRKPPRAQATLLPAAATKPAGDPSRIDWKKLPVIDIKASNDGYPADRPASFQAVHDGTTLYLKLSEMTDTSKIVPGGLWWAGDHWGVFFARAEKGPYKYFRVPLQGAAEALAVDPEAEPPTSVNWADKIRMAQSVTTNEWAVMAAIPFTALGDGHPVKPSSRLYFNVVRNSFGGESHLTWSPTFESGYYSRTRAGFLTLLPR